MFHDNLRSRGLSWSDSEPLDLGRWTSGYLHRDPLVVGGGDRLVEHCPDNMVQLGGC